MLLFVAVAASVAIGLFCCGGTTQREAAPAASPMTPPSAPSPTLAPAAAADGSTATPGSPQALAPSPNDAGTDGTPAPDAGSRSGSGSAIVSAVSTTDPDDLGLYSSIERELRREPPAEVRAIVRRRSEGASRDELTRLARELPDLQLRVLVLRWVDRVFGAPKAAPAVPGSSSSARPFVKPIAPVH